ncbi:MAG: PglZ domain-containing protein [Candidatus Desulfaltia sp.]|nr:PglZ domain-containing protein [Candidatus Desulfaltia sp.]
MTEDSKNKASISYIGDLAHIPPDDVILVESDGDYVRACQKLSRYWESHDCLRVWVRSKNHFAWLRDFTEQIGCSSKFEEKTARLVLAEQWNVTLPDWLTDADVLEQNLLEIDVDFQQRTHFETRFLTRFLGGTFQTDIFSASDIVPAIKTLVSNDAKEAFEKYPLLQRCLENRCDQWEERSSEIWLKEVCKRLPENSGEIWQWLSLWAGLHCYPDKLLEYVLAPEQILFVRGIPPGAVRDLPLEPTAREQMLTQIEFFFEEIREQVTSSDEFQKVVGWTTGKLSQEYRYISGILKSKQFPSTEADIRVVQEKFKSCPGVSESQLNSLVFCVKPSRPTLIGPEEDWSSAEWIRWTVKEYMPYRIWQVHNGQYDADLEQTVARFSDWYISEYASIHKDPDLSLTHCLRNITSSDSSGEFTIILLIDCLPIAFMKLLDQALRNVGLSRHDLHYRFAGLPTITEYNKTALLSGNWQNKAGNYEAVLKNRSASDWSGKNVVYLSNLKSLSEMEAPQETTIAVLNFVDGDEILHSDVEAKNTTHEDELHRIFSRMAESVNRLSQEWAGSKKNFNVYVVTDHGACRILDEEKRSFDSAVVNKLFANEKHRFSAVAEDQVNDIPDNLWLLGHRFKRPFSDEKMIYFLPRGHNTVRQTGITKGYMHGGATPEEVIVPTASYKMVKVAWKTPDMRFLNLDLVKETGRAKFYIQRVVTLKVEIQNPNPSDIRILRASVTSPETDLKSCEVVVIPAGSVNTLQMSCYFKKAALGEKSLEIEIAYEVSGEQHTLSLTLECEFKSAMAGGFSLRDL